MTILGPVVDPGCSFHEHMLDVSQFGYLDFRRRIAAQLISRTVYPTIPPRVDYELTDLGRTLIVPLKAVHAWTVEYQPAILAAREKFAERERQASFTTPKQPGQV